LAATRQGYPLQDTDGKLRSEFRCNFNQFWPNMHQLGKKNGAQGRNRTTDTAIFSRMLYQLSYLGIPATGRPDREAAV
jgi:hypothetical protein